MQQHRADAARDSQQESQPDPVTGEVERSGAGSGGAGGSESGSSGHGGHRRRNSSHDSHTSDGSGEDNPHGVIILVLHAEINY